MSCPCGPTYSATAPQFGDGANDLLYKIAASLSLLAAQAVPSGSLGSGSGSGTSASFNTAPNITIATTGTAVNGLDIPTPRGVVVCARQGNAGSVFVGGSNITNDGGFRGIELLQVGMTPVTIPISNLNQLYINGTAGDRVGVVIL